MSKYYTPPRIICDLTFGRLHSFACAEKFFEELENGKIEFITSNPPYGDETTYPKN